MQAAFFLIFVSFCRILMQRQREIFMASIFLKTKSSDSKKNSDDFFVDFGDYFAA